MAQMTKRALAATLKQLLEHKTLDKITVSDLTEACGVNRQTFYYHFKDIYDLLEWIYKDDATRVIPGKKTYENWMDAYLKLFYYAKENKALVMNTYHSLQRELLENYVYSEAYLFVKEVVDECAEGMRVREEDKAFLAKFYQYAFVGLIFDWLDKGMKEEPEHIVKQAGLAMDGNMLAALKRMEKIARDYPVV